MDRAQLLVRQVLRAFYSTIEILVIEALVMHSCLWEKDLSYLVGMNEKDLRKICGNLANQRFLVIAQRGEQVADKPRPQQRTYYFIDYRQAVDGIKWRYHRTTRDMLEKGSGGAAAAAAEAKDFICPRCHSEWSTFQVLDNNTAEGFRCHRCNTVLEQLTERVSKGHQESARMNNQFKFMTDLLPQIDNEGIPECTFDKALAAARPVVRAAGDEVAQSKPLDAAKPTAVKGLADTGPKTMSVKITDGNEEHATAEETRRRKEQLAANALPSWITESSVPTSSTTALGQTRKLSFEDENPAKKVKLEVNGEEEDDEEIEFEDVV